MRAIADAEKVRRFMEALGQRCRGPGRVYLTGGGTAVLAGWRSTTIDVDLKMSPEPEGAFEALAALKDELDINVELAAPDQFIPPAPGWMQRSIFIARYGEVDFYHYDPVSQSLAKIERGNARDLLDAREMVARGWVALGDLEKYFASARSDLLRYPAIDSAAFEGKVTAFVASARNAAGK